MVGVAVKIEETDSGWREMNQGCLGAGASGAAGVGTGTGAAAGVTGTGAGLGASTAGAAAVGAGFGASSGFAAGVVGAGAAGAGFASAGSFIAGGAAGAGCGASPAFGVSSFLGAASSAFGAVAAGDASAGVGVAGAAGGGGSSKIFLPDFIACRFEVSTARPRVRTKRVIARYTVNFCSTLVVCAPTSWDMAPSPKDAPNPSWRGRCMSTTRMRRRQTRTSTTVRMPIKMSINKGRRIWGHFSPWQAGSPPGGICERAAFGLALKAGLLYAILDLLPRRTFRSTRSLIFISPYFPRLGARHGNPFLQCSSSDCGSPARFYDQGSR